MSEKTAGGGIGFCGLLTIVFITLKLTKVIDWSWAWVLSPLWLPFVIVIGVVICTVVIIAIASILAEFFKA